MEPHWPGFLYRDWDTGGRLRLREKSDEFSFRHVQFEVSVGFPECARRHRTGSLKTSLTKRCEFRSPKIERI